MLELARNAVDDLLVRVSDLERSPDERPLRYQVTLTLNDDQRHTGTLDLTNLGDPPDGDARAIAFYGLELFQRLFAPPLDNVFQQAWGAAQARQYELRVRLWLDSSEPHLHALPWELLHYDTDGGLLDPRPLATDERVRLARYLRSTHRLEPPPDTRPIRLLLLISAPSDLATDWPLLAQIDKAAEERELRTRLRPMITAGLLTIETLPATTPAALEAALREPYHVLLYFGHALYHPDHGTRLLLEHASSGKGVLLPGETVVRQLAQSAQRPDIFILVACDTARPIEPEHPPVDALAHLKAPTSLAEQLVVRGNVPAVLAMQHLVDMRLARTFTRYFSEDMLRSGVIDSAVRTARRHVYDAERTDWATPVLYMRRADGQLFAPNARLEYLNELVRLSDFARWQGAAFIHSEAVTIPPQQALWLVDQKPQAAPPASDVLDALGRALHLDGPLPPEAPNLVALVGPPRSGQTTTLHRLAWELARKARAQPNELLPVALVVPLAEYPQQRGSDRLEQTIIQAVAAIAPALAAQMRTLLLSLDAQPADPLPYVFLLDGLDAIPDAQRAQASAEINELAARLPGQRVLVSSIRAAFPARAFRQAAVVLMQPLTERLIMRYLRQRDRERSARLFRLLEEAHLLEVATDPLLLTTLYTQLTAARARLLSRNQLLQHMLDEALGQLSPSYLQGDAAMLTLTTLAWRLRWQLSDELPLPELFALLNEVRGSRDYHLDTLLQELRHANVLKLIGPHTVRFAYPALQSYAAALALQQHPDWLRLLETIIAQCGSPRYLRWWQDTIFALAGLLPDPTPLLARLSNAALNDRSGTYPLLLARTLQALPAAHQPLAPAQQQVVLDVCSWHLHSQNEPDSARRAQIAVALGSLDSPGVVAALARVLVEQTRLTVDYDLRYDYAAVRLAAARTLRPLLTLRHQVPSSLAPLLPLFHAWTNVLERDSLPARQQALGQLRTTLSDADRTLLERTLAAFALGDLSTGPEDAQLLLTCILSVCPQDVKLPDWYDTIWTAAAALALFDAATVTTLISDLLAQRTRIPRHSVQPLTYVVGRLRVFQPDVVIWLVDLLLLHRSFGVKARALQALAWQGRRLLALEWLDARLAALHNLDPHGPPVPALQRLIELLAAWDVAALESVSPFVLPPLADALDDPHEVAEIDSVSQIAAVADLRTKALDALGLLGDAGTSTRLEPLVPLWPLALRLHWHRVVAQIAARTLPAAAPDA